MGSGSPTRRWASAPVSEEPRANSQRATLSSPFPSSAMLPRCARVRRSGGFAHSSVRCRCAGTQTVGDGSGCTWKTKAIEKAINASCLYERIDSNIEVFDATAKGCFSACPSCTPPTCSDSKMTDCYLKCYSDTSRRMTPVELSAPWMKAFQGARSRKEQQRRRLAAYPLLPSHLLSSLLFSTESILSKSAYHATLLRS